MAGYTLDEPNKGTRYKTIAEARKAALKGVDNRYGREIFDAKGDFVGSVRYIRQDNPERSIVHRYVPAYKDYRKDTVSILNKDGTVRTSLGRYGGWY